MRGDPCSFHPVKRVSHRPEVGASGSLCRLVVYNLRGRSSDLPIAFNLGSTAIIAGRHLKQGRSFASGLSSIRGLSASARQHPVTHTRQIHWPTLSRRRPLKSGSGSGVKAEPEPRCIFSDTDAATPILSYRVAPVTNSGERFPGSGQR
jgi:hypothetical protein